MNEENNIFIHLETLSGRPVSPGWPYSVPSDYFSSFKHNLLERINDETSLPQTLSAISKEMPYSVPGGYFDALNQKIVSKLPSGRQALKVIHKNWWKMTSAAAIFGLFVLVSLILYKQSGPEQKFAQVGNTTVTKINYISTEQLAVFLNVPDSASLYNSHSLAVKASKNFIDFNQLFENISDKDLKAFLEETAAGDDDFLLN